MLKQMCKVDLKMHWKMLIGIGGFRMLVLLLTFSHVIPSLASVQTANVSAVVNGTAILPWIAKVEGKIKVVVWERASDQKKALVYRSGETNFDDQDEFFRDRASPQDRQLKNGNVSWVLTNVTKEDEGEYECLVRYEGEEELQVFARWRLNTTESPDLSDRSAAPVPNIVWIVLGVLTVIFGGLIGFLVWACKKKKLCFADAWKQDNRSSDIV